MKTDWMVTVSDFFFKPVLPYALGVFRMTFGFCVCVTVLLLHSDWLAWFGVHGWVSMETISRSESGFRLNLFAVIPQDDRWIMGFYWLLLVATVTLTFGLWTRLSSVVVYLGLNSLNQRNPLLLHGGDTFLRAAAFFLMFAYAGAALSLDNVLRRRKHSGYNLEVTYISPWPQRMIQIQLAIVYLAGFSWKAKGAPWRNGSALFYVIHLREIRSFPLPAFVYGSRVLHFGTWLAMAFELLFPLLVWFKPFRRPILIAGLLFHLSLEYALNIPMFQWDMLCAYPLFLDSEKIVRLVHDLSSISKRLFTKTLRTSNAS